MHLLIHTVFEAFLYIFSSSFIISTHNIQLSLLSEKCAVCSISTRQIESQKDKCRRDNINVNQAIHLLTTLLISWSPPTVNVETNKSLSLSTIVYEFLYTNRASITTDEPKLRNDIYKMSIEYLTTTECEKSQTSSIIWK